MNRSGIYLLLGGLLLAFAAEAQTDSVERRPGIYFPQAPKPGQWRRSMGVTFTVAPPELTEELRISIPAADFNIQRGLGRHLYLVGRVQSQLVQSSGTIGIRYALPLSKRFFVSVGDDMNGWYGFLKIKNVFDSYAVGLQNYPNVSIGFRPASDLQYTLKAEAILDLYYRSAAGGLDVEQRGSSRNGYAFTFVLEQPYYHKRHVSVGIRAAYTRFNWQFWALYSTFDKRLFYPELLFNFIH
ncbi:hypothetical protein [Fibrella aquatilis]|uniref:Outer membrane protein beta-barrel domain-containing protein n=1 Tax=Fibrella aquatilis TaxID=2817059 RepID=A0A939K1P3_9BACT|nr:hypothetical protein [Fibrella aquatilis]MBO0933728.1 hypothetical protein [Fibrella aquatilis]